MNIYLDLFLTFAKIGVLTFGGGMAMFPILEREVVEKKHWAEQVDLVDYYAIGQCTPGIIAVNTATFIGEKLKGKAGAVTATLGVVFPSVVIINILAAFLLNFSEVPAVQHAFAGIRAAVCALIFSSVIKLYKAGVKGRQKWAPLLFLLILCGSFFLKIYSPYLVLFALVWGLIFGCVFENGKEDRK